MSFEPKFENLTLSQTALELTDKIKAQARTEISTDDISKILNVNAISYVEKKEVSDGKIEYNGKVVFFVCYQTTDGEILKSECKTEFSGQIKDDKITKSCKVVLSSEVEKTEADASGVKLQLSANLLVNGEAHDCMELKVASNGENLICDCQEKEYLSGLGIKESIYPIEEEFEFNCVVKEVLSQRAQAVVTACQCGVDCIIVDGEVYLSAILLQKGEKTDIIRKNEKIPFRAEIECEEAMPSFNATAKASVKSLKTDISVDQDKNLSVVNCSILLQLEGEAVTTKNVTVIKDAFSLDREIKLIKDEYSYFQHLEPRTESVKVSGVSIVSELPVGAVCLACGGERFELASSSISDKGLKITGVLLMTGYFSDGEDKIFTRKMETPIEIDLDNLNIDGDFKVKCVAVLPSVKILSLTETEINSTVMLTVYPKQLKNLDYVKDVVDAGEKKVNNFAISVYIPTEGEELWSLSKRLNVSPEELERTNPELQFPLNGSERIVIYRQK